MCVDKTTHIRQSQSVTIKLHRLGGSERGKKNMKYDIIYFKSQNLTPDERNSMRKNQTGVWLMSGIRTSDRKAGLAQAKTDYPFASKFRSVPVR